MEEKILKVRKNNKKTEEFDKQKIIIAIKNAADNAKQEIPDTTLSRIANDIYNNFYEQKDVNIVKVEDISNLVEDKLKGLNYIKVFKQYIYDNLTKLQQEFIDAKILTIDKHGTLKKNSNDFSKYLTDSLLNKLNNFCRNLNCDDLNDKLFALSNNIITISLCANCGKPMNIRQYKQTYCSVICGCKGEERISKSKDTINKRTPEQNEQINKKREQTCLKKYKKTNIAKTDLFKAKYKNFCEETYGKGIINAFQVEEVKNKIKQTCLDKWGCENPQQSEKIKEKSKQTCLKNYGVEYASQSPIVIEKQCQSFLQNYPINSEARANLYLHRKEKKDSKISKFELDNNCIEICKLIEQFGTCWLDLNLPQILLGKQYHFIDKKYLPKIIERVEISKDIGSSKAEKDLINYIKSFYKGNIIDRDKKILGNHFELDIYLPELNIGIEYNGQYWHNYSRKGKYYHLNKSLLARNKNIRLIHIYEFEDIDNQKKLLKDLINGTDNYPPKDFNKNNLIGHIPRPHIIFKGKTKEENIYMEQVN